MRGIGRALVLALAFIVLGAVAARAQQEVTIGYQLIYNPWKVAIVKGKLEKATGYKINWRQFDSGAKVISAMALGEVQIAMAGSSPIAAGISRGIDVELFWITEDIASAEALVVRDGSGISAPQGLIGKTLGVPFASTTHFHTLFALEQFGIDPNDMIIRNMQPLNIVEAWRHGDIDAAFVWDPALGKLKETGKVLITSGLLSSWGKATFDGMIADRAFAIENPEFMCQFVKTMAMADEAYRVDPEAWSSESSEVEAIVNLVGGDAANVPEVLALYAFPTLDEQASSRWLGGGSQGGAARALKFTSEFLKSQKKLPTVFDDYSGSVNVGWVEMVRSGEC